VIKKIKTKYYRRNRKKILDRLNKRYAEDENFREQIKQESKERYHNNINYREQTIKRAIERYKRLKKQRTIKKK
jgi:predicted transcriptional regulator